MEVDSQPPGGVDDVGFVVDKILYEGEFDPHLDTDFPEDFRNALVRVSTANSSSLSSCSSSSRLVVSFQWDDDVRDLSLPLFVTTNTFVHVSFKNVLNNVPFRQKSCQFPEVDGRSS